MLNKAALATLATLLAGLTAANLALADPRQPGGGQGPGGAPNGDADADAAAKAKAKANADAAAAKARADAEAKRAAAAAKANADAAAAKAKADAAARAKAANDAAAAKANANAAAAKAKADADARRASAKANADAAAAKAKADADAKRAAAKANADAAAAKAKADADAQRAAAKANADAAAAKAKSGSAGDQPGGPEKFGRRPGGGGPFNTEAGPKSGNRTPGVNFGAGNAGSNAAKADAEAKAKADALAKAKADAEAKAKADADAKAAADAKADAAARTNADDNSRKGRRPNGQADNNKPGDTPADRRTETPPAPNPGAAPGANNWHNGQAAQPADRPDGKAKDANPDPATASQRDRNDDGRSRAPTTNQPTDQAGAGRPIGPDDLFGRKRYQALPADQARANEALREEKRRNDEAFERAREEARRAAEASRGSNTANPNRDPGRFDDRAAARFDDIRRNRRERVLDGGVGIFEEPDRRVIVRRGDRAYIRHDEVSRFDRPDRELRRERRPDGTTLVVALGIIAGVQILSVLDDDGHLIRRSRRDRDGREITLIDNSDFYRRRDRREYYDAYVDLPPPRLRIPEERYIVEYDRASEEDIYEALSAPPVERLSRSYSLEEVRQSYRLRERMRRVDLDTINFAFASWEVDPDQYDKLERIARAMKRIIDRNPDEMFMIEGHTDAVGSDLDNLSLSDRRAESVAIILSDTFRVPPENLTTQGYGEEFLKVPTDGPERENRRVAVRRITPLLSRRSADSDDR